MFDEDPAAQHDLARAIEEVQLMKTAALYYAGVKGWSDNVGLYFHVFGHNSVNSLHLHILDLEYVGPTFWRSEHKNCPIDAIIDALREEVVMEQLPNQVSS